MMLYAPSFQLCAYIYSMTSLIPRMLGFESSRACRSTILSVSSTLQSSSSPSHHPHFPLPLPKKIHPSQAEALEKKLRYIVEDVPNRLYHLQGSQAGASSATFHIYRHARRREQTRLQMIEEEAFRAEKDGEREVRTTLKSIQ